MRKEFALLVTVSLCLATFSTPFINGQASIQESKFHKVENSIPNQYLVVLTGTNFSPIIDPTPSLTPSPTVEPTSSSTMHSSTSSELITSSTPSPSPQPAASLTASPLPEEAPPPDPDVIATAEDLTNTYGGTYQTTWGTALKGFLLSATESIAIAMSADPRVAFIEEDAQVSEVIPNGTPDSVPIVMTPDPNIGQGTQHNAVWGLDRIDQRALPLNSTFTYHNTGRGVNVYVIDTGIRPTHWEFSGRAFIGYDALGEAGHDCNGHGTHVAGTIGGRTFGVAKGVRIFAVRVLNCAGSGSWSSVIDGVNWVTWHRQQPNQRNSPAVANMSLGGAASSGVDVALKNSIRAGVTYAVAVGNSNADARSFSPARVAEAITVGATDWNDYRAEFSNYGPALDLFAPGVYITSAWIGDDLMIRAISGTSMAAPHAAGVAALYLQSEPDASPAKVRSALVNNSTSGVVKNPGLDSPNRLLFTNY